MIFSSLFFICIFLPITLILYYIVPWKFKNVLLLIASLIFYSWGEPVLVLLMIFSIVFNYLSGLQMSYLEQMENYKLRKIFFIVTVAVNIAVLCFFKYEAFFTRTVNSVFGADITVHEIGLPTGISFYTFQILSYIIDVYWGNVPTQRNIIDFGTYVTMFPQLIAGPIVRYDDIRQQLRHRTLSLAKTADGAAWFIKGLAKKVLLANNIGMLHDAVFAIPASERAAMTTLLGVIAYTFQIYFDFSGYSDMAIGLGKMLGFKFVQNFDYPYISKSVTEFWRRWHISLGTWFREYVYIPLGGNRVSTLKHIRNIMIVWALTGFWHGAAWNFLIWGLYYGVLLIIEKYLLKKILPALPSVVQHIYTIILFVIGWLIFCSDSLAGLGQNIASLFGGLGNGFADSATGYFFITNLLLLILCVLLSTPLIRNLFLRFAGKRGTVHQVVAAVVYMLLFAVSICYLVNSTYNPFLYFRF